MGRTLGISRQSSDLWQVTFPLVSSSLGKQPVTYLGGGKPLSRKTVGSRLENTNSELNWETRRQRTRYRANKAAHEWLSVNNRGPNITFPASFCLGSESVFGPSSQHQWRHLSPGIQYPHGRFFLSDHLVQDISTFYLVFLRFKPITIVCDPWLIPSLSSLQTSLPPAGFPQPSWLDWVKVMGALCSPPPPIASSTHLLVRPIHSFNKYFLHPVPAMYQVLS